MQAGSDSQHMSRKTPSVTTLAFFLISSLH
jgi:hypothetical protein